MISIVQISLEVVQRSATAQLQVGRLRRRKPFSARYLKGVFFRSLLGRSESSQCLVPKACPGCCSLRRQHTAHAWLATSLKLCWACDDKECRASGGATVDAKVNTSVRSFRDWRCSAFSTHRVVAALLQRTQSVPSTAVR